MTALKWEDIDLSSGTLKVVAGKGGKTARVNLSSTLVEALEHVPLEKRTGYLLPARSRIAVYKRLEWRYQDPVRRSAFLHVNLSFLNLLAMALPVTSFMVITLGSVAASHRGESASGVIIGFWLLIAATALVVWLRSLLIAVLVRNETGE